jgi:hypothetical protein
MVSNAASKRSIRAAQVPAANAMVRWVDADEEALTEQFATTNASG